MWTKIHLANACLEPWGKSFLLTLIHLAEAKKQASMNHPAKLIHHADALTMTF
jgi:hypothetical protein